MPSKVRWRPDEPARHPLYLKLHERMAGQDSAITWLLLELRALQKRVAKLEQHSADTASWKLKAAYEAMDEVRGQEPTT